MEITIEPIFDAKNGINRCSGATIVAIEPMICETIGEIIASMNRDKDGRIFASLTISL